MRTCEENAGEAPREVNQVAVWRAEPPADGSGQLSEQKFSLRVRTVVCLAVSGALSEGPVFGGFPSFSLPMPLIYKTLI